MTSSRLRHRPRRRKKTFAALAVCLLFFLPVSVLFADPPAVPYGGYNIVSEGGLAKFYYPDVVKRHFDEKVPAVLPSTPTLDRMRSVVDERPDARAALLASDEQGVRARFTSNEELVAYLKELPTAYMRMRSLGRFPSYSAEGQVEAVFDLPLLVFSRPPRFDAEELRALGKPVVYLQGQIHGDEASGADAMLAIARDLSENRGALLDRISVIMIPRLNVDGAWRNQRGTNTTAPAFVDLDQNRDAIATLSPVTRAVRNMLTLYRPEVTADFHEMGYLLEGSAEYAPDGRMIGYRYYPDSDVAVLVAHPCNVPKGVTDAARMLERAVASALERSGLRTSPYVYEAFMVPGYEEIVTSAEVIYRGKRVRGWITHPNRLMEGPPDECIFDSAMSLAPSVTLLFEARSPKVLTNFGTRVHAHYLAGMSLLEQVAAKAKFFRAVVADGANALSGMGERSSESDDLVLWTRQGEEKNGRLPVLVLDAAREAFFSKTVPIDTLYRNFELTSVMSVKRPYAYVVSADAATDLAIAGRLALTGVTVSCLEEPVTCEVEAYRVDSVAEASDPVLSYETRSGDYFPLNPILTHAIAGVSRHVKKVVLPRGAYLFRMAQPSAVLAALAVEPMANRNLANYWYSLEEGKKETSGFIPFVVGEEYPVYRLMKPVSLPAHDMTAEIPIIADAFVARARPVFPSGIRGSRSAVFAYSFSVEEPYTKRLPSSFRMTLPRRRGGVRLRKWSLYDPSHDRFEPAEVVEREGIPEVVVDSRYIDSGGNVTIVAAGAPGGTCLSTHESSPLFLLVPFFVLLKGGGRKVRGGFSRLFRSNRRA